MTQFTALARIAALAAFVAGGLSMPAHAQDVPEAHLNAARQAIASINATNRYDNILPGLAERLKGEFIQGSPNFEEEISRVVDEQALALAARRADLEREAATIYAKAFSQQELEAITAFYATEAGKKLLSTGPLVARELTNAAEIWANGISRDLTNQSTEQLRTIIDANPIPAPTAEIQPAAPAE